MVPRTLPCATGQCSVMGPVTWPPEILVTWTSSWSGRPAAASTTAAHDLVDSATAQWRGDRLEVALVVEARRRDVDVLGVGGGPVELERGRQEAAREDGLIVRIEPLERRVGRARALQLPLGAGESTPPGFSVMTHTFFWQEPPAVAHDESQPVGGGTTGPESLVLPSPNVPTLPSVPPLPEPPPDDELLPPSGTSKPFLALLLPQAATTAATKTKANAEKLALLKRGMGRKRMVGNASSGGHGARPKRVSRKPLQEPSERDRDRDHRAP